MRRTLTRIATLLLLSACQEAVKEEKQLTYYDDIKPIIDEKCVSCHRPDTVAPFNLISYDDAFAYREAIADAVANRTMPPWSAAEDCKEYADDRSLTSTQREQILRWVAQGAKKGPEPDTLPPLPEEKSSLSHIDLSVSTPVYEVNPPEGALDDHRCFLVDIPNEKTTYVTGLEVVPGNPRLVHHVVVMYVDPEKLAEFEALDEADPGPGWYCLGGAGEQPSGSIGGWVPGWKGNDFPKGYGKAIQPGGKLILNMHYNTLYSRDNTDQTTINLAIGHNVYDLFAIGILNPGWLFGHGFNIKAGDPNASFTFRYDPSLFTFGRSFYAFNAYIHMHQLGKSGKLTLLRKDGTRECLLDIPKWDFDWQAEYFFKKPVVILPGDELEIECVFDNSAENQRVINGVRQTPQDISWGGDAPHEMCAGVLTTGF